MTNIKRLRPTEDGFEVEYNWTLYRFLLADGRTVDIRGIEDGSWLRAEVVKQFKLTPQNGIAGVAMVPDPQTPTKKAAGAKKAAPK